MQLAPVTPKKPLKHSCYKLSHTNNLSREFLSYMYFKISKNHPNSIQILSSIHLKLIQILSKNMKHISSLAIKQRYAYDSVVICLSYLTYLEKILIEMFFSNFQKYYWIFLVNYVNCRLCVMDMSALKSSATPNFSLLLVAFITQLSTAVGY